MQNNASRLYLTAMFAVMLISPAFAQDVLGITPVSTMIITAFKLVGIVALGWGFAKLWNGNHQMGAMVMLVIGLLGVAKLDAIAAVIGLGV